MERPAQGGDRLAHSTGREEPGCSGRGPCSGQAWADLPLESRQPSRVRWVFWMVWGWPGWVPRGQKNCDLWVSHVASNYKQSALHNKGDLFSDVTEKSRPREGGRQDQVGTQHRSPLPARELSVWNDSRSHIQAANWPKPKNVSLPAPLQKPGVSLQMN